MFYRKIIVLTVSLLLYSTISSANHTPTTKVIEKVMPAVVEIIAENNSAVPASGGFKFRQKVDLISLKVVNAHVQDLVLLFLKRDTLLQMPML